MSRAKLALASVLVVFAVGAVSSASAMAAGQWYINGSKFTGEESIEGNQTGTSTLEMTISGIKTKISCTAATGTGKIKESNKDTSSAIKFTGCTVAEPSGCKTTSEIKTTATKTELEVEGEKVFDKYTPESGETFTTIPIEGCAVEGSYKVTGSARCEIQSPKTEAVEKECAFSSSTGSKLKFGANTATFTGKFLYKLTGTNKGKVWSAKTS